MFTPLEQFEIINIIPLSIFGLNISITNSTLLVFVIFSLMYTLLFFVKQKDNIVPNRWQLIIEKVFVFAKSLISENMGTKYFKYFVYIYVLFFFLLLANLLGMIPYSFTVTSHLIFTFTLSFSTFFAINIIGIRKHGLKFFGLFLPTGAPLVVAPYLIIIELISYIARVFSLAIRLFANMMSGHTLLKILAGFGWTMASMASIWALAHFIPLIIVFLVTGLEIAIACLQAYVFTVLVSIYLNDVIHLH
jgi:ATP synthase subunit 6